MHNPLEKIDSREASLSDFLKCSHPDLLQKTQFFARFLEDVRQRGFETYLGHVKEYSGGRAVVDDGKDLSNHAVVMMCSADYLGLAQHASVIRETKSATDKFGASVSSVPLIAGATSVHRELEHELGRFIGSEAVVLFPTGHAANLGVIQALCGSADTVVIDKLVHYSILDAVRLSTARWHSFGHSDPEDLNRVLTAARSKRQDSGILVVIEGVYGIDGDVPLISDFLEVCSRHGASLMVDEAHATGVLGATGRGSSEHNSPAQLPSIVMGSLSKSLGSFGGWIAVTKEVADYLRYYARTIAFSVGLPASCVAASLEALRHIQANPDCVAQLKRNSDYFRQGLIGLGIKNAGVSKSAIMSAVIGDERILRDVGRELFRLGVWAEGLPFPAVPRGQERVRFRLSAQHTTDDLNFALQAVDSAFRKFGLLTNGVSFAQSSNHSSHACMNRNPAEVIVRPATDEKHLAKVAELACRSARLRAYPVPWLHRDQYVKILSGRSRPLRSPSTFRHFAVEENDCLMASVTASLECQLNSTSAETTGSLGHLHWLPGKEIALAKTLAEAKQWLEQNGVQKIFAPMQTPLLVFGGGIPSQAKPATFPFLQPHLDPVCAQMLRDIGFLPDQMITHTRIRLAEAETALPCFSNSRFQIRSADKTQLLREIKDICPLINQSIGGLPLCGSLDSEDLYGIAYDLKDVIQGELWKLAEDDGRSVGFIGAFPDVTDALTEADGSGGTADIERINQAISATKRASIVWLAVASSHVDIGLGRGMLKTLYGELLSKGFTEAWLHWEFMDGQLGLEDFLPPKSAIIDHLDYTILKWEA